MNRTSIEWVRNPDGSPGYTFNPITGCLNGCPYCYARKLANGRLKFRYLANPNVAAPYTGGKYTADALDNPFYPRFWEDRLGQIPLFGKSLGIFACDMSDLFGIGVPRQWTDRVLNHIGECQRHRFYLLTKQPQNLIKWSPFPDNCWVGVSATDSNMFEKAFRSLMQIEAKVKYVSLEPLLDWTRTIGLSGPLAQVNWVIIGSCTGTKKDMEALIEQHPGLTLMPYGKKWTLQPRIEWVEEILSASGKVGIPIFLKDNLGGMDMRGEWDRDLWLGKNLQLRQELPRSGLSYGNR